MTTEFEWDEAKASSNFLKHGVTFGEAGRLSIRESAGTHL